MGVMKINPLPLVLGGRQTENDNNVSGHIVLKGIGTLALEHNTIALCHTGNNSCFNRLLSFNNLLTITG